MLEKSFVFPGDAKGGFLMPENGERKEARSPLCILIVEDSNILRRIFSTMLSKEHVIETAANVEEGWDLYLQKSPDIVFLDIMLPDGNGHDLAHRIKDRNPESFIIMATVSDTADDKEQAAFNHVDGFLTKPFGKQKIDDVIARYWTARR